ncbi:MAG TPA: CpaF family protein [Acidimicrobiales bacterium]|nr:CpaF family protein [Acidimicrobiales bacterium]
MKLSEKLAVLEQKKRTSERPSSPAPGGGRPKAQQASAARPKTGAASPWDETKRKVRDLVLAELAPKLAAGEQDAVTDEVKSALDRILEREDVKVSPRERQKFVQEMIQDTLGYGPLEPLLADESISEIMCNAYDDIWVERKGRLERVDVTFTDVAHYHQVIEKIVSGVGRRIDESAPMVDARLPDGSRVNAVIPPLAFHGAALTIRKFAADPLKVDDLVRFGAFTPELATVMEACVRGKLNILVSGGTGTGKTTNLNVLSSFIPEGERIITIEDAAELQLQQPHVVALEARPPNAEGAGEVKIRDLVRNALRMRPDRIIVGEVRGAEALDMLQAMNTGHEGSMTTVHSNSPRDAISRLETMVLMAGYDLPVRAIREQIVSALHVIMHLDRLPSGRRVVTSVTEVQGMEGDTILLQELFRFQPDQSPGADPGAGTLVPTGLRPKFLDKLAETGVSLPMTALQGPGRAVPVPEAPSRRMRLASRSR